MKTAAKKKAILWGIGSNYKLWIKELNEEFEIIALTDSNYQDIEGAIAPNEAVKLSYDVLCIIPSFPISVEIFHMAVHDFGISKEKIFIAVKSGSKSGLRIYQIGQQITIDNVVITLDSPLTYTLIEDTFISKCHQVYVNADNEQLAVIDVGMHEGVVSLYYANMENVSEVWGFELSKGNFELALSNFKLNTELKNKIKPFNVGLSDVTKQNVNAVKSPFNNIVILTSDEHDVLDTTASYDVVKASDALMKFFEEHEQEKILLKIDIEGHEYNVLSDLESTGLLQKIHIIDGECTCRGQHDKDEFELTISLLNRNGFVVYPTSPVNRTFPIVFYIAMKVI